MIRKNIFYNMLLSVSSLVFPLVTFPYASRILGPQGIGALNFIDSITQYFLLFAALGVPIYGIREISKLKNDSAARSKIFSEIVAIHVLSTLLFSAIYLICAFALKDLRAHLDLVLVGVVSMYFGVFAVEWFYQGIEQFAYITKRSLIVRSLSIVLLFIFLKPGSGPIVYSLVFATVVFLNGLINIFLLKKHVKFQLHHLEFKKHLKPLVFIFSSAIAVSVYTLMDNIILGFIQGETAVGIYATALKIVKIPLTLIVAIGSVMVPQVSRAYNEQKSEEVNELINKSFAFTCIIGVPIAVGLFISAPFLVRCFAGTAFENASVVVQILSPVVMVIGINSLLATQLFTPLGMEKLLLKMAVACMVFSLASNIILVPFLSYTGAAITNLLTECLLAGMLIFVLNKNRSVALKTEILYQCLGVSLLFIPLSLLVRLLNFNYYIEELAVIALCIIFYGVWLLFFSNNAYIKSFSQLLLGKLNFIKI